MEKIFIDRLDHQGRGISYKGGKIIFVDGSLDDEEVICEIDVEKKKYYEGHVTEILKMSSSRVKPKCPYYELCGGCNIMHMSYEKQLDFKKKKLSSIINKYASSNVAINDIVGSKQFNYRNKITLKVNKKIGLYKKQSNDLVNINECLIVDANINKVIKVLSEFIFDDIKQIIIRSSINTNEIMVCFDNEVNDEIISELKKYVSSIYVKDKLIYGNSFLTEVLGDYKFVISPSSFFQVNTDQAFNIYMKVLEYCKLEKNDVVLDLYCGTGTIGIFLSKHCKSVIGIELNPDAIKNAWINAEKNKISNIEFYTGDVGKVINNIKCKPNVIVVDPPRSGLSKETINFIINLNVKKLIYVSCDPMTLARDIKLLSDKYSLQEVTPFDMFPNTYHVESVCILERK
ncbi:MAG: 23S rRNA (uracil(1939)-C(5))-methyltransferase RlmD [Bacilli bacterium]|nr:23S rRNA (uracil(1939)-C(5))-methyltransferase RlmD [Bacilli bacterium]